jgi:hypothetical protein
MSIQYSKKKNMIKKYYNVILISNNFYLKIIRGLTIFLNSNFNFFEQENKFSFKYHIHLKLSKKIFKNNYNYLIGKTDLIMLGFLTIFLEMFYIAH